MSELVFYNTRTRSKEPFVPIEPGKVGIYSCGPTVYARAHLGNMRAYLFADLLRRTLESEGYEVQHVINITDVGHLTDDASEGEDKMEVAARREGRNALDIAAEFTRLWQQDVEKLGCRLPHVLCRATDHIQEQIDLGLRLEEGGYTYSIDDGLYFDVSRFPHYVDFARLDLAGPDRRRIQQVAGKRNAADFAIWKFASSDVKRQQEWDSPWGRGFPGWHLECSAMSTRYLGEQFDIHTGGEDHVRVHHTNEIAQSECGFGVHPWVRYWMHNAFIDFKGDKMSKSKGTMITLDDLEAQDIDPRVFRYWFLQAVYRQPQTYTDEAIAGAATGYRRLLVAAAELRDAKGQPDPERQGPFKERFRQAMRDDLNAPKAMAVVWEVVRQRELPAADRRVLLQEFDAVLGLDLAHAKPAERVHESDPRIDGLVADRESARKSREFAEADRIRDSLADEGISIIDTPEGPRWSRG